MPGSSRSIVTRSGVSRATARDRLLGRRADADDLDLAVVLEQRVQRGGVGPRVLADQDARARRLGVTADEPLDGVEQRLLVEAVA